MVNVTRYILAGLALVGFLFGPIQAQASVSTTTSFYLDWSGALWGNDAQAHGILTINNDSFPNPSNYTWLFQGAEVADFTLTISGAASGNGSFGSSDFDGFAWNTVSELDLSRELIGQETGYGGWGSTFDGLTGDFNLFAVQNSGAPFAGGSFLLVANEGFGNIMNLVSFRPVPVPAAFWLFGSALLGFIGVGQKRGRTQAC